MDFEIKIINLHWINNQQDDPQDICLHGKVFLRIGNEILDDGKSNNDWTVSAGAYRMLQTLYNDHALDDYGHLLPCCGHFMFIDDKSNDLVITGCPNGIDWEVTHDNGQVNLFANSNAHATLLFEEYKEIVFGFADEIKAFYDQCTPKASAEDFELAAYERFWSDWEKMRSI